MSCTDCKAFLDVAAHTGARLDCRCGAIYYVDSEGRIVLGPLYIGGPTTP